MLGRNNSYVCRWETRSKFAVQGPRETVETPSLFGCDGERDYRCYTANMVVVAKDSGQVIIIRMNMTVYNDGSWEGAGDLPAGKEARKKLCGLQQFCGLCMIAVPGRDFKCGFGRIFTAYYSGSKVRRSLTITSCVNDRYDP